MDNIQLNDLSRQYANFKDEIEPAVTRVLNSGWYILGNEVQEFEKEFAKFCGVSDCVSVGNGTDALELALRACDINQGDEVITVANAGMYSSIAILNVGAIPLFVDIEEDSFNICPEAVKSKISNITKAIIVTHLYGQLADIENLRQIADDAGIPLIEDCAQAHGAMLNNKKAGSWGDCAAFSFYPTKNLGALGDGGAVLSNNQVIADKVRNLRQYGWSSKYNVKYSGGQNSRLDEIQAAILRIKLRRLDYLNQARVNVAKLYLERISHTDIHLPSIVDKTFVAHLFVIRVQNRQSLVEHLKNHGIGSEVHYPILDYQQDVFENKYQDISLRNSECASSEILTLPCYPELRIEETLRVCEIVNSWQK